MRQQALPTTPLRRRGVVERILVIDDEPGIVQFLQRALTDEGYAVDSALDGERGLELARQCRHDLVLLDLLLPSVDGLELLEDILEGCPGQRIIVLSAVGEVESKVRCLELGASDYLPKPFELAELLARVRARLRGDAGEPRNRMLRAGRLTIDLLRRTADVGAGPVHLSERELLLLQHLHHKHSSVCTREELLNEVWGYSFDPGSNIVDVYVRRLRAKLGSDAIETVRNVGYYLST